MFGRETKGGRVGDAVRYVLCSLSSCPQYYTSPPPPAHFNYGIEFSLDSSRPILSLRLCILFVLCLVFYCVCRIMNKKGDLVSCTNYFVNIFLPLVIPDHAQAVSNIFTPGNARCARVSYNTSFLAFAFSSQRRQQQRLPMVELIRLVIPRFPPLPCLLR